MIPDPRLKAAEEAKRKKNKELINKHFNDSIQAKLSELSSAKKALSQLDEENYRQQLAVERERKQVEGGRKKTISSQQIELARNGLSGQVVALMGMEASDDENESNSVDSSKDNNKKKEKKAKRRKEKRRRKVDDFSLNSSNSSYSSESSDERRKRRKKEKKRRLKNKKSKKQSSRKEKR